MRPYKGVVLEKYNCSLLQGFVCGLGFDGQYCNLMFAQKAVSRFQRYFITGFKLILKFTRAAKV